MPLATFMFLANGMLLCWTLDIVPLVIKLKVAKETLQLRSDERRTQVRRYFIQTELTSELNLQKKRKQLCLQTELTEKNHNLFTHRSYRGEHDKSTPRKKKILAPNAIKKFCMQSENILTNLSPSPTRSEKPGLTYNSEPCHKFHSMSSTVLALTTRKYIQDQIKMHNRELAKSTKFHL